jgi:predicted RNase H-like nuclease (RuvC/YqgF family)
MATNENDILGAVLGNMGQLLGAGGLGAILGSLAIIIAALIKRQSPMAALIDARIRTLIEGYERRIDDLRQQIEKLESKVDSLTQALEDARQDRALGDPTY